MNLWKKTVRIVLVAGAALWMYGEAQKLSTYPSRTTFNPEPETGTEAESETIEETDLLSETAAESETASETQSEDESKTEDENQSEDESETEDENESEDESETEDENQSENESETGDENQSEDEFENTKDEDREAKDLDETESEDESESETIDESESESESENESESGSETIVEYAPGSFRGLRQDLNSMISEYEGSWSIYVKDLESDTSLSINPQPQPSASLIKLYIAGAVLEEIHQQNLERTDTIDQLLCEMITVSDNEASNELVRYLSPKHDHQDGMSKVNEFIEKHDFTDTWQYNGLEDSALWYHEETPNVTSVTDCGRLLEEIYKGEFVSHLSSYQLEGYLLDQELTWKIPAGIPSEIKTANKTGEKDDTQNDIALVFTPYGDYIICIMSTDLTDSNTAIEHIRDLSGTVYEFFTERASARIQKETETEDSSETEAD